MKFSLIIYIDPTGMLRSIWPPWIYSANLELHRTEQLPMQNHWLLSWDFHKESCIEFLEASIICPLSWDLKKIPGYSIHQSLSTVPINLGGISFWGPQNLLKSGLPRSVLLSPIRSEFSNPCSKPVFLGLYIHIGLSYKIDPCSLSASLLYLIKWDLHHPYGRKWRWTKEPLDESEREE